MLTTCQEGQKNKFLSRTKTFTYRNDGDKCCFARILKTNKCELKFFFPEKASQPIQKSLKDPKHGEKNKTKKWTKKWRRIKLNFLKAKLCERLEMKYILLFYVLSTKKKTSKQKCNTRYDNETSHKTRMLSSIVWH